MDRVLELGSVTLRSDLIFGCLILVDETWVPFRELTPESQEVVRRAVISHPLRRCLSEGMERELRLRT